MQTFERQVDSLRDLQCCVCYLSPVPRDYVGDLQKVGDLIGGLIDDSIGDSDSADDRDLPYEAVMHHLLHAPNESHAILLVSILADRFHYECNDESFQWISESQKGLLGPGCSSAETARGVSLEEWNPW
jgi:hypothetical protein